MFEFLDKIKRFFTAPRLVFLIELVIVLVAAFSAWPKELLLFSTALLLIYFLLAPLKESLPVFIASIPLFVAMPLTAGLDQVANWRIFVLALFISFAREKKWFSLDYWKKFFQEKKAEQSSPRERLGREIKPLYVLPFLLLLLTLFSLTAAPSLLSGLKKIAFLINILLLFPLVGFVLKENKDYLKKLLSAMLVGLTVVLAIAGVQLVLVFFIPLFSFWQFWAQRFINVFYGSALAVLLERSNTWFAYYKSQPPTLRLFSVFPDSHSFAMFLTLCLPAVVGCWALLKKNWPRRIFWGLGFCSLLAVALSGSRGAWVGFIAALAIAIISYQKARVVSRPAGKFNLILLSLFLGAFLLSFIYPPFLYLAQRHQQGLSGMSLSESLAFFERAKSISDVDEVSNKGRLEIWDAAIKSVAEKPWLGVGVGNFPSVLGEKSEASKKGSSAHNLYLDFAVEIGVFGAVTLTLIFLYFLKMIWANFVARREEFAPFLFLALFIYMIWVLSYSLFDVVLLNDKVLMLLMIWLAVINFFYEQRNKQE